MRIGLSTKITEPTSAASFVVAEEPLDRVELTLYVQANSELTDKSGTFGRKNNDGNYYNTSFPDAWTDLNTTSGVYSVDPFASYRTDTAPEQDPDSPNLYAFPVIDRHLTVNIIIDSSFRAAYQKSDIDDKIQTQLILFTLQLPHPESLKFGLINTTNSNFSFSL